MTRKLIDLPSGGVLKIDQAVAEVFLAHIERCCANDAKASARALRRRDALLVKLGEPGRRHVRLMANTVASLCPR